MTDDEIQRIPRSKMPWVLLALGILSIALVWGSTRIWEGNPEDFTQDVIAAYETCDEAEIKLLAAKHNLQLVFEPCGSNNFLHYAWSPNGVELYYHTNSGPWLLNGETQELKGLPVGFPISNAVWFNDDYVAFAEKGVKTYNIDVYDVHKNVINITGIQQVAPRLLTRGQAADEVLFLAAEREPDPAVKDDRPPETLYRLRANTGTLEPAFPWLNEPVVDYTYSRHSDLLAYRTSSSDGVVVARGDSGEVVHEFPGIERASVSTDGRFIALEGPGQPISIFHQQTEEDAAAAEEAGEEPETTDIADDLPEYLPREVQPPTLWILDTTTGERHQLQDVFGYQFQWYEAKRYYASFVLWGMENKEFNRNVVLTDLTPQLRASGVEIDLVALAEEDRAADEEQQTEEPPSASFSAPAPPAGSSEPSATP